MPFSNPDFFLQWVDLPEKHHLFPFFLRSKTPFFLFQPLASYSFFSSLVPPAERSIFFSSARNDLCTQAGQVPFPLHGLSHPPPLARTSHFGTGLPPSIFEGPQIFLFRTPSLPRISPPLVPAAVPRLGPTGGRYGSLFLNCAFARYLLAGDAFPNRPPAPLFLSKGPLGTTAWPSNSGPFRTFPRVLLFPFSLPGHFHPPALCALDFRQSCCPATLIERLVPGRFFFFPFLPTLLKDLFPPCVPPATYPRPIPF